MTNPFIEYLSRFSEAEWLAALEELLAEIHKVDRKAVQIWFRFFPLELHRHVEAAADREEMIRGFALQGDFEAHLEMLRELGVAAREVRTAEALDAVDALVIPGGESSTMLLSSC